MTIHFKIQRRIQRLVKHVSPQKTPYYMFDWVQNSYPARKKAFEILTFLNPLIKFVTSLEEILKCPECQIS